MPADQHADSVMTVMSNGDLVPMFPREHMAGWWHDCLVRRCVRCNREMYRTGDVCEVCRESERPGRAGDAR